MNTCNTLSTSSRLIANKRSAACELEGEIVILNLDSGIYFGLNAVGATIWNYIQSQHSLEEIVSYLLIEYKVDRERCEAEVALLLQNMITQGLIDIQDAPAA